MLLLLLILNMAVGQNQWYQFGVGAWGMGYKLLTMATSLGQTLRVRFLFGEAMFGGGIGGNRKGGDRRCVSGTLVERQPSESLRQKVQGAIPHIKLPKNWGVRATGATGVCWARYGEEPLNNPASFFASSPLPGDPSWLGDLRQMACFSRPAARTFERTLLMQLLRHSIAS